MTIVYILITANMYLDTLVKNVLKRSYFVIFTLLFFQNSISYRILSYLIVEMV